MKVLMLDGGMGTELARRGFDVSDTLWSARALLQHPDEIEQVHYDYLAAGADCITTASYQISIEGFAKAGLSREEAAAAFQRSVELARRARGRLIGEGGPRRRPVIAASVGPFGAALADGSEYRGAYHATYAELYAFHYQQVHELDQAQPDLLACETLPSGDEADVLMQVLRHFPTLPAWFSFTCANERLTAHGEEIAECARVLDRERQVVGIGVNCTAPQYVAGLIGELRNATRKPIVVYPNAGRTWDARARAWVGETVEADWGKLALDWYDRGARWIGGCCGTTPETIRAMRASIEERYPGAFEADPESSGGV